MANARDFIDERLASFELFRMGGRVFGSKQDRAKACKTLGADSGAGGSWAPIDDGLDCAKASGTFQKMPRDDVETCRDAVDEKIWCIEQTGTFS